MIGPLENDGSLHLPGFTEKNDRFKVKSIVVRLIDYKTIIHTNLKGNK